MAVSIMGDQGVLPVKRCRHHVHLRVCNSCAGKGITPTATLVPAKGTPELANYGPKMRIFDPTRKSDAGIFTIGLVLDTCQSSHHETSLYFVENGNDGGPEFRNLSSCLIE
jgi:hypothetical protein